jgi:hypothetical protein
MPDTGSPVVPVIANDKPAAVEPTPAKPSRGWFGKLVLGAALILAITGHCHRLPSPSDIIKPTPVKPTPVKPPLDAPPWPVLEPPHANKNAAIELPEPMEVADGRKYVVVTAKAATPVQWLVNNSTDKPLTVLRHDATTSLMIFPNPGDDTIAVIAYTAVGGLPSDPVITFIRVKADKPPPQPDPTPAPTPNVKSTKLHVTYVVDFAKQTPAIGAVLNNSALRTRLADAGHKVHEVSIRDSAVQELGLTSYVEGKPLPLVVLQTQEEPGIKEGRVLHVGPMTSIQQVQDAVTKALAP